MDSGMGMPAAFTTSHTTTLYSKSWTPSGAGSYAGTCIFLVILAIILRCLFATKAVLEQRWLAKARDRRYVLVKGKGTEAGRIDIDIDAKTGSLITSQGVEENVKVVRAAGKHVAPFRLSVDVPRAVLVMIMTGVAYLLMLAVMTMNVGYYLSILAGTFVGELAIGRYIQVDEH